jgi:outer membrane protein OmpA-like peptidoglycan-associated protein
METAGWGEERPIAANDTPEGRARNRRLEMTVLSK